ncbi:MAG: hypothetical protein ACK2U9_22400, partial [Anaerolineae bacterium]
GLSGSGPRAAIKRRGVEGLTRIGCAEVPEAAGRSCRGGGGRARADGAAAGFHRTPLPAIDRGQTTR